MRDNVDYMEYLIRKSIDAIQKSKGAIEYKQIWLSDFNSVNELKKQTDGVSKNGYLILAGWLASKVGYDNRAKKYVVVAEGRKFDIIVSFEKMQTTSTCVRDIVGSRMDTVDDFTEADIVVFAVKNNMKVLEDGYIGFEGIDVYAFERCGFHQEMYSFFLARDKDNRIMIVDEEIYSNYAEEDNKNAKLNNAVNNYLSDVSDSTQQTEQIDREEIQVDGEQKKDTGMGCGTCIVIFLFAIFFTIAVFPAFKEKFGMGFLFLGLAAICWKTLYDDFLK